MVYPGPTDIQRLVPQFVSVLMDNLSDMVFVLDLKGRLVHANRTALTLLGYSREEVLRTGLELFLGETEVQTIKRIVIELSEGGGPKVLALGGMTKGSKKLSLEMVLGPLMSSGLVIGIWARAKDLTERKNIEVELEEARNFIEKIVSSLDEGLVTVDREGTVIRWSPGTERILSIPALEMADQQFYIVLKDDNQRRRFHNKLKEVMAGGRVSDMEYTHVDRNDHEVTFGITSSPLYDRQGRLREIVLVIKDLTEKKHLEERLKESEKRLATEVIKKIEDLKYIEQLNRLVVEYMEEGALLLDPNLDIGFVNPMLVNLLGYKIEDVIGKPLKLIVPEDLLWAWNEIKERAKRGSYKFETAILRKDGEEVPVMVTSSSIKVETRKAEFLCTVIDLSEQKAKEEKMREEMMEFKLKAGNIYLLLEKGYGKAMDILLTLKRFGHRAIIVSRRTNREVLKDVIKETEAEIFWLEEKGRGAWALAPTKDSIMSFIDRKIDRTKVLLLDRCDYLVSMMDFDGLRDLIHGLADIFYHRKAILVLLVDPNNMSQQNIEMLEKDASLVEAKRAIILPEDLHELLIYIYQQNRIGSEPSYKEIGKRFNITKTTTRKRVQQLTILDLAVETKHGRTKVLRVTDRGTRFVPTKNA
jgi:PAS domain S-box-containing protein